MSKPETRFQERGVALVIVLWLIVLLSVIGVSHSRNVRIDLHLAKQQLSSVHARALAETGLNRAILELFNKDETSRWLFNGELITNEYPEGTVHLMIRNTSGLVDINTASPDQLHKLLLVVDMQDDERDALIDAILDWRDSDDLRRLRGAEDEDYALSQKTYGTPDKNFQSINELRYVLGMTSRIHNQLAPYITVYSGLNSINPVYADKYLLSAMNSNESFIKDPSASALEEGGSSSALNLDDVGLIRGNETKVFHISTWAKESGGGEAGLEVDVDISLVGNEYYRILSWQESSQGLVGVGDE